MTEGNCTTEPATLIDSNLIIYAHDQSAVEDKREKAAKLIESHWGDAFLTTQVLGEVYRVLAEKKKVEPKLVAELVTDFSDGFTVLETRKQDLRQAIKWASENQVPIWDALIAATTLRHGVYRILTEDTKGFSKIPGIHVENPFKKS